MSSRRSVRHVREVCLTAGAALGALCILLGIASVALDVRPLMFRSGSMAPAIHTGDLAIARTVPAADLGRGDIVSVVTTGGDRITHRVVSVEGAGGTRALTLKGDANPAVDTDSYSVSSAEKVLVTIPKAGYVVAAASSTPGVFVLGLFVAWLLTIAFRRGPPHDGGAKGSNSGSSRSARRRVGSRRRAVRAGVVVSVLPLVVAAPAVASWSDPVTTVGTQFSTLTVASQAQPGCTTVPGFLGLGDAARVTWTKSDSRYVYDWEVRGPLPNATVQSSGTVGSGQAAGQTVTLDISTGFFSGTNGNYEVVVTARLGSTATWTASTSTTTPVRRVFGASMRCGHS